MTTTQVPTQLQYTDVAELERVYRDTLGVPKFPVREAVDILREFNGIDLFAPKTK